MKKSILAALLLSALTTVSPASEKKDLLTILTSPEPQTQLMSMVLTMQAIQQGSQAHLLLCGPAGDLALKDAPASAVAPQKPKGMSPQGLMKNIISKGGKVEVCAIYLPNKGVDTEALIDGIKPAKPSDMAKSMLVEDTRVISF